MAGLNDYMMGGGASTAFVLLHANSDTTPNGYVIAKGSSTVKIPVPATAFTDSEFVLSLFESIDFKISDDGTLEATVANDEDTPAFWKFLEKHAIPAADTAGTAPSKKREDGVAYGGSSSTGFNLLMISAGGISPSTGLRKVTLAVVNISPTSGSFKQKADEMTSPSVVIKSIKSAYELTIPKTFLDPALYDVAAAGESAPVLTKGQGFKIAFFSPKKTEVPAG